MQCQERPYRASWGVRVYTVHGLVACSACSACSAGFEEKKKKKIPRQKSSGSGSCGVCVWSVYSECGVCTASVYSECRVCTASDLGGAFTFYFSRVLHAPFVCADEAVPTACFCSVRALSTLPAVPSAAITNEPSPTSVHSSTLTRRYFSSRTITRCVIFHKAAIITHRLPSSLRRQR